MRQLKDVYPEYEDRVWFLAVNVDPLEQAGDILSYMQSEGFTWPMTVADTDMVKSYNVTRQAAHVTLDSGGLVVSSVSYGGTSADQWRDLFEWLLDSPS